MQSNVCVLNLTIFDIINDLDGTLIIEQPIKRINVPESSIELLLQFWFLKQALKIKKLFIERKKERDREGGKGEKDLILACILN